MEPEHPRQGGGVLKDFANAFLVLFALDAGLSVLDELLSISGGAHPLGGPRNVVASATLFMGLMMYVALGITPRLPKSVFVPPILFLVWAGLGGLPVTLAFPSAGGLVMALGQAVFAAAALLLVRRRAGRWLFTHPSLAGPVFRWRNTLGFAAANLLLIPVALMAYGAMAFAGYVQQETRGFVSFDATGVNLDERRYVRDENEIWLVGMMHIGEGQRYGELFDSFAQPSTIVLQEGVTDEDGLIRQEFSYGDVASSLGLGTQPILDDHEPSDEEPAVESDESEASWPHVRRADLDVNQFSPETVDFLNEAARVWGAADLQERLRLFLSYAQDPRVEAWERAFYADLVDKRNLNLLEEMDRALEEYSVVVVPWGGIHLPGVEEAIEGRGFQRTEARSHRLLSYSTILGALLGR